jgi:alkylhydroperoxidase family enzyme
MTSEIDHDLVAHKRGRSRLKRGSPSACVPLARQFWQLSVSGRARRHFSEKELVDLTAAVIAINAWNRAAIAFVSHRR